MRLIDADAFKNDIKHRLVLSALDAPQPLAYRSTDIFDLADEQPTVEAVPLEDYRSMEQTVYKLTQALAEAEPKRGICEDCLFLDSHDDFTFACKKGKEIHDLNGACDKWRSAYLRGEAEPTKHGRWRRTEAYPHKIYCSECYATFIRNDELLRLEDIPHDYCPCCGARMDGGENEVNRR